MQRALANTLLGIATAVHSTLCAFNASARRQTSIFYLRLLDNKRTLSNIKFKYIAAMLFSSEYFISIETINKLWIQSLWSTSKIFLWKWFRAAYQRAGILQNAS
jgi:hypothetical protein